MLTRVPLLDATACAHLVDRVLAHRARWTQRGPTEFYTLGPAIYLDRDAYDAALARDRELMLHEFADVHELLLGRLAHALGTPAVLAAHKAPPGFHIWGVPGIPTRDDDASLHFDLQYRFLLWPPGVDPEAVEAISFTLPLRLPAGGGGLSIWDLTYDRMMAFQARTGFTGGLPDLATLVSRHHEPYRCGELVIHSGRVLHRIAAVPAVESGDLRVTLQGHALHFDGCWQLYW